MFDKSKLASILEDEGLVKTAAYPGDVEIPREFLEKMFNANKSKVMDALKKSKTPESPDIDLRNLSFGKPTLGHAHPMDSRKPWNPDLKQISVHGLRVPVKVPVKGDAMLDLRIDIDEEMLKRFMGEDYVDPDDRWGR